ncbi:hypothetical protein [Providencia sneebia]
MDLKAYSTKIVGDGEEMKICGLVNAKNSYGAYAGSRMFISHVTITGYRIETGFIAISSSNEEDKAILEMCNN